MIQRSYEKMKKITSNQDNLSAYKKPIKRSQNI